MFVKCHREPAAYMHQDGWLTRSSNEADRWRLYFPGNITPLYDLAPQELPREPLSEGMIYHVIKDILHSGEKDVVTLVRAIEKAHGIGEV